MPAAVHAEVWSGDRRLAELGLSRDILIQVVQACVAAHGGCTENDAVMAKGWQSYLAGVRRSRELLRPVGWEKDDTGGFATVVDHGNRIRLAVMNTDDGTCRESRLPLNRSRKGPNSARAASVNQELLPGIDWPMFREDGSLAVADDYATWHLCVFIDGDMVRAELALLHGFEGGYFTACHERIFLVNDGDWGGTASMLDDDDLGPEVEVEVRRK